ncbi:hypothetical protein GIB67_025084 [Kingdonia uniflora]|uniref:SWIRM domain-containing protein n=1 Tax=Kingdonia uniflora TaxID=39325 RepID=A0A7J7N875_9MAGN|nr:hypothetical protein GIB67_025084 [Kingdonia uniflora]
MESSVSVGIATKRSLRKVRTRNYNEDMMDELEKHLGSSPRKKNKTMKDMEKETKTEAVIALSLGFPIDELLEEEIEAGVVSELDGKEQNDYIVVRNHILVKWRDNVHTWLSKAEIRETVSSEYENLLVAAYDFLLSNGYINFGVSQAITSRVPDATKGSVIIVGAGLAGLAAAKQLLSFGFKVIVLEGRNRPGGRVYTQKMGLNGKFAAVDLGGSIITGCHANPLGVLARQLSIPLHNVRDKCPLYKPDGAPVDKEIDAKVESIFNKLLERATEFRKIMGGSANDISLGLALETFQKLYGVTQNIEERQLLDWHLANLEYANAGCLSDLSVEHWDQDDPYEMDGDHCLLAGGNWRLIKAMCEDIPIFYGKTVDAIKYGNEGVEVASGDQLFQADMILCTVPLGVLKNRTITFQPELPKRKLDAIERLGFGLLNKVAMVFPQVFWGEDLDTFGCLNKETRRRGEFFLFYSYHTVSGGPVLIALVAGETTLAFEATDPAILIHRVLSILRGTPYTTTFTQCVSDPEGSGGVFYEVLTKSFERDLESFERLQRGGWFVYAGVGAEWACVRAGMCTTGDGISWLGDLACCVDEVVITRLANVTVMMCGETTITCINSSVSFNNEFTPLIEDANDDAKIPIDAKIIDLFPDLIIVAIFFRIFSPKGVDVPDPVQTLCTKWGSDPLCYGSYSHVRVGSSGDDYNMLAESVGGRLFFAGEATNRQHPATMHGAFLSGLREASCILHATKSRQTDPAKCIQRSMVPSGDLLAGLFKKPDLAFGKFSFIFDSSNEESESMGIMRVTCESSVNNCEQEEKKRLPLVLYGVLSRKQARELQLVDGGDEVKLSHLFRHPELKLTGSGGLGSLGNSLTLTIASSRKGWGRHRSNASQPKAV